LFNTVVQEDAMPKYSLSFVLLFTCLVAEARAQVMAPQRPPETIGLSGPRVGVTFLSDSVRGTLRDDHNIDVGFAISQFGWQKEKRFLSSPSGFTGVTEFVFLLGGVDQGIVLPSVNWLVGARTANGVEFAAGPNLTPAGLAVAIAGGVTFQTGNLNIPVNVAVVPSKSGMRVSMLAGFNMRKR
jgi:hypothetical protein